MATENFRLDKKFLGCAVLPLKLPIVWQTKELHTMSDFGDIDFWEKSIINAQLQLCGVYRTAHLPWSGADNSGGAAMRRTLIAHLKFCRQQLRFAQLRAQAQWRFA